MAKITPDEKGQQTCEFWSTSWFVRSHSILIGEPFGFSTVNHHATAHKNSWEEHDWWIAVDRYPAIHNLCTWTGARVRFPVIARPLRDSQCVAYSLDPLVVLHNGVPRRFRETVEGKCICKWQNHSQKVPPMGLSLHEAFSDFETDLEHPSRESSFVPDRTVGRGEI